MLMVVIRGRVERSREHDARDVPQILLLSLFHHPATVQPKHTSSWSLSVDVLVTIPTGGVPPASAIVALRVVAYRIHPQLDRGVVPIHPANVHRNGTWRTRLLMMPTRIRSG